ncbi:class I adenylate-forming enzyme family protein [Methyloligella sp. 2.7D]|uniref:AMP-binding protein n=1 Tax=unclassified Methyloligella TaxID=2625955 RepID=UPI00157D6E8C|nr:class I adenylate-forming enzyme family protein [Methyloligella sp. GL2]QKP77663.1 acyl--CoA ligase [Methyloligella sp. GL2]
MSPLPAEELQRPGAGPSESVAVGGPALFRQRAERRPDALALADTGDRASFGFHPGRSYTYAQGERVIDRLCGFFTDHGLAPGDIVAIQMPNVAETVLTYLAASRAGLTIAALPYLWGALEVSEACVALEPAALIGGGKVTDKTIPETHRDVAALHMCVRLVAGLGPDLPDGIAGLDALFDDEAANTAEPFQPQSSHAPVMYTFTARPDHPLLPVPHRCDELLALGAMAVLALGLTAEDRLLNAFPLTGPAGLALGVMPWLVSGGALIQHQPFDLERFKHQALRDKATVTALPPAYLAAFAEDEALLADPDLSLRWLGRVVFACGQVLEAPDLSRSRISLFDAHPLGDLTCVLLRYAKGADPALLPRGKLALGPKQDDSMVFVETALSKSTDAEGAELLLRGPAVPKAQGPGLLSADARGFVGSGLPCLPEEASEPLLRLKCDNELIQLGGFSIAASELDTLYTAYPACEDAAVFTLPDPLLGNRLCAALVPKPGQESNLVSLNWYLAKRQAAVFKQPDRVITVDRIPRDREGRVLRHELAEMAEAKTTETETAS